MRSAAHVVTLLQVVSDTASRAVDAAHTTPPNRTVAFTITLIAAIAGYTIGRLRARAVGAHRTPEASVNAGPKAAAKAAAHDAGSATPHPPRAASDSRFDRGRAGASDVAYNSQTHDRHELDSGIALVCDTVNAVAGTLWRIDPAGDTARAAACYGRALPSARALRGDPLGWVAREGTPLRIEPPPAWATDNARVVALRLWQREDRGWILTLELPLDADVDVARLDATAAPLRLLVELQERRSETDADRRRLNSLLDILHRIPVATELVPAANELIDACVHLSGATGGTVGIWDGETGRIVSVRGEDGGPQTDAEFASPTSEMALSVRADGPLVRTNGVWKPGPTQMANSTDRWNARPRAFACIPLSTSSGITAVLAVWSSVEPALDNAGLELISAVAPYAALHLKHAGEFGRMKETAETDALTGLRNRRAFDAAMQLESSRYERYARPLALLMIDMDHFKAVNDKYGHEAGDEVLRRVAERVRSCVRDVDTAARFGGEELAVLLPETPLAAAREVAERIRATVAGSPVRWAQESIKVTVSIGLASVPESVDGPAALLSKADEALYNAKKTGRNRVS